MILDKNYFYEVVGKIKLVVVIGIYGEVGNYIESCFVVYLFWNIREEIIFSK